jgi:hypothetical protein
MLENEEQAQTTQAQMFAPEQAYDEQAQTPQHSPLFGVITDATDLREVFASVMFLDTDYLTAYYMMRELSGEYGEFASHRITYYASLLN